MVHGKRKRLVKNGIKRLVVLNNSAKAIIEQQRGLHPTHVFFYRSKPISAMNNSAWQRARKVVGLQGVRIHDLKHTFGRRLRAAGVSFEDRQDLLGHKSARLTTHYSTAELHNLLAAANKACVRSHQGPALTLLRTNKNVSYKTGNDVNGHKMDTIEQLRIKE